MVKKILCSYIDQMIKARERDRPALSQTFRTRDLKKVHFPLLASSGPGDHTQPSVAITGSDGFSSSSSLEQCQALALTEKANSACINLSCINLKRASLFWRRQKHKSKVSELRGRDTY